MQVDATTKVCTGCGEAKALDEFHRSRKHSSGRVARCKSCEAERAIKKRAVSQGKLLSSITHRDGCSNPGDCSSKSERLCPSCSWTRIAQSEEGRDRILKMVNDREAAVAESPEKQAERRARLSAHMKEVTSRPDWRAGHAERNKDKSVAIAGDDDVKRRRAEAVSEFYQHRAFMERMEREAEEWERENAA